MDFDEVMAFHRLEKNTSRLTELPIDFVPELKKLFETESKEYQNALKEENFQKTANFSNLKRVVIELFHLRQKKMLNKALISVKNNEYDEESLLEEEKPFYREMCNAIKKYFSLAEKIIGEQKTEKKMHLNKISIKLLSEVPAFIGPDMKEYGPFKKEEKVLLPKKTAELLLARNLAEKLE